MTQLSLLFSLLLLGAAAVANPLTGLEPPQLAQDTNAPSETTVSAEPARETNAVPETATPAAALDLPEPGLDASAGTHLVNTASQAPASSPEMTEPAAQEAPAVAPPPPGLTKEDLLQATRESLAPTVEIMSARLNAVERRMDLQHQDALAANHDTTRTILLVAGSFATAVLFGVLLGALILARAVQKMASVVVAALPPSRQLGGYTASLAAPEDSTGLTAVASAPVEQVTHRFLGTIEKLEQRIVELEHTARDAAQEIASAHPGNGSPSSPGGNGGPLEFSVSALSQKQYGGSTPPDPAAQPDPHDEAALWIGKGQALLNLGNSDEALACFDKAVEAGPRHSADAFVKRGMALERMEKIEDAVESYDQAIAADGSMTLAYLYKGAACNRLQRYREALDCYEIALKCEQKLAEH